jgi:hypothetical protein
MRHSRRLAALEQQRRVSQATQEVVTTDGAEYGLDPIDGGWAVFLVGDRPVKAIPQSMWDSWPEQGSNEYESN